MAAGHAHDPTRRTYAGRVDRTIYLPPFRVDITRRGGVKRLVPDVVLARVMAVALEAAGAPTPASVGLILADDRELTVLNRVAMATDGPTDVLSFPLLSPSAYPAHRGQDPAVRRLAPAGPAFALPPGRRVHLGEIVVSVERAAAQAGEGRGGQTGDRRWSAADELRLLVTHGTLHLCGWDHAEPAEETAMRALERRLLGRTPPN
jgi:probable rRNA maturation factor